MITQYALRNNNRTPLLLITLCMCCALTTTVHAQDIHIPDPNLRAAIADELNIAHDAPAFSTSVHICLSNFCPDLKLNKPTSLCETP